MSWSKQLRKSTPWLWCAGAWVRFERALIDKRPSAVRTSFPLLHLARAGTRRIGLPAWCTGLGHQALQYLCFTVEHRARLLTAQNDQLERLQKYRVELGVVLAQADR